MVDVKVYLTNGMFPRIFLKAIYKDDYLNDVVRDLELPGDYPEKFIEKDVEYFRKQLKAVDGDLDFVANELEDAARDYTSKISSRDFIMLNSIIDEMADALKRIESYTKTREALRAAVFYLEKQ